MSDLSKVTISTECPITKLGPVSITIDYAINSQGVAVGLANRCCYSIDGNATCHKCVAFFSSYVSFHPLPKNGDFIPADLVRYSKECKEYQEYVQPN